MGRVEFRFDLNAPFLGGVGGSAKFALAATFVFDDPAINPLPPARGHVCAVRSRTVQLFRARSLAPVRIIRIISPVSQLVDNGGAIAVRVVLAGDRRVRVTARRTIVSFYDFVPAG